MKMERPKRKARIYQEEAKVRQTSHWDWDYLPMKTLERLARRANAARPAPGPGVLQSPIAERPWRPLRAVWACWRWRPCWFTGANPTEDGGRT